LANVRAGDHQHDADRSQEHPEAERDVAERRLFQCAAGEEEPRLDVAERELVAREGRGYIRDQGGQLGARAVERRARTQPRDPAVVPEPEPHRPRQRLGDPHVDAWVGKCKRRRHDADDLGRNAADHHRPSENARIAAVAAHPQGMRQQRHLRRAGPSFILGEPAPGCRRHLQHRGQRRRDVRAANALGLAIAGEGEVVTAIDGGAVERTRALRVVKVEPGGEPEAGGHVEAVRAVIQLDQPIRLGIRQRVQHYALHDGEDRGVGADRERQRQHGGDGERRAACQSSQGVPQLLPDSVHGDLLDRRLRLECVAEFARGLS
jgi:hypothetical protein